MHILPPVPDKGTLLALARLKNHEDFDAFRRLLVKYSYAITQKKFNDAQDPSAIAQKTQDTLLIIEDLMEWFDTASQRWESWDQKEKAQTLNKGIPPG